MCCENSDFIKNWTRITGVLCEDQCTFLTISHSVHHRMRNVSDIIVEKIRIHIL